MIQSMRRWSVAPAQTAALRIVFFAGLALTAGGLTPFLSSSLRLVALMAALAILPLLLLLADRRPALAVGLFVAVQPLEAFEVATPLGTASVGILILLVLLVMHGDRFLLKLKQERALQFVSILLLLWMAAYPIRLAHEAAGSVGREMITISSFLAVAVVGASLSNEKNILKHISRGAMAALVVLGTLGILASLGLTPEPARITLPRELLGFRSPFSRNYGLDVVYDSVSLLFPLCVPFLSVRLMRPDLEFKARCSSLAGLAVVAFFAVLVFQARGMILGVMLGLGLSAFVTRPKLAPLLAALATPVMIFLVLQMVQADAVSSGLREASFIQVGRDILSSPLRFAAGVDEHQFYVRAAANAGFDNVVGMSTSTSTSIHNIFLSNLVAGGYLAFFLITSAYLALVVHVTRRWRANPRVFEHQVLLVAAVLVVFVISIEPVRAAVVGSWLVMGLALGGQAESDKQARHQTGADPGLRPEARR